MTYKATPEQWAQCEEFLSNPVVGATDACVLELRARVEALEATSKPSPNFSQIGSSLVERVEDALMHEVGLRPMARAAIREVAAWMTSNPDVYFPPALVFAIEQEAER